jgi:hypothetical protein
MNYFYSQVENVEFPATTSERGLLLAHLQLVASALKAIELVDSGDRPPGSETPHILKCLDLENPT